MWMLCLDASAPRTCVALGRVRGDGAGDDELVVGDEAEDRANQTSVRLHLRLSAALERAGIGASELGAVACGRGPGTFTGSRVAVATAKGLAIGVGAPAVPVSTLASLAASSGLEGRVLALLDARRGQVYGAVHRVGDRLIRESEERVIGLGALLESLESIDGLSAFGPRGGPDDDHKPEPRRSRSVRAPGPTAAGLWRASVQAWRRGAALDPGELSVVYLRQSYAEMGINAPKRSVFKSPLV